MGLTAELVRDERGLDRYVEGWDALAVRLSRPYCAPGWMLAWWRHVAPTGSSLRVVVVHDGGEVRAVAPFFAERARAGVVRHRLLAAGTSVHLDVLCPPEGEREAAPLIRAALDAEDPGLVCFEGTPISSPWPAALASGAAGRREALSVTETTMPAPFIAISHPDVEAWYASKSRNFRSQMRKSRKRLDEAGARIAVARTPDEVDRGVRWLAELHHARWEGRGGSAVMDERVEAMLRDAGSSLDLTDRFRLVTVDLDGEPIAAQLYLAAGEEVGWWLGGHSDDWDSARPQQVVMIEALGDAMSRVETRLDLGSGDQPFKYRFADDDVTLTWATVVPRGPRYPVARARVGAGQARRFLAGRLSPEAKARVKRGLARVRGR